MIRALSRCPYCTTKVAFDWHSKAIVFNPDTGLTVCHHVVWVAGTLRSWSGSAPGYVTHFRLRTDDNLEELFFDIEMNDLIEVDTVWEKSLPTVETEAGQLDGFVIYALHPEAFRACCEAKSEQYGRLDS
ncbi:MAG TPA: hypothetical protein VFE62_16370 [Gemmataceae bacterium]|nr:hypothetical protein [Gemmataceae bacterium]